MGSSWCSKMAGERHRLSDVESAASSSSMTSSEGLEVKAASDECSLEPCVVVGPSGVGKGTLLRRLRDACPGMFSVAVSHTTRGPREGEVEGVHYHFVSKESFEAMVANGEFLEWANVHANMYGTSVAAVKRVTDEGHVCLLEIDYQGAERIKREEPFSKPAKFIFITCEGEFDTLKCRLENRSTESLHQIAKRMETAETEFKFLASNPTFFDCVFSNDDLDACFRQMHGVFVEWYPQIKKQSYIPAVVCGPSGVGKGTLLTGLKEQFPGAFSVVISHTTRGIREGEVRGTHYHYISKEEFEAGIKKDEFVEYAQVHGNYYGTSKKSLQTVAERRQVPLLEIDVQGFDSVCKSHIPIHSMFVTCEGGICTLEARLKSRGTETEAQIKKRMDTAKTELQYWDQNEGAFEVTVVNTDLQTATEQLVDVFSNWYPWISEPME